MSTGGNTPNTTHTSFFPQALDSDGNAIIPSSFKIDKIELIRPTRGGGIRFTYRREGRK